MHDVVVNNVGFDVRPVKTTRSVLIDGLIGAPALGAVITVAITSVFALTGDAWTVSDVLTFGILAGVFLGLVFGVVALVAAYVASALRPKVELRRAQNRDLIWVSVTLFAANFVFFSRTVLWEVFQNLDRPQLVYDLLFAVAITLGPSLAAVIWIKFIRRFGYLELP